MIESISYLSNVIITHSVISLPIKLSYCAEKLWPPIFIKTPGDVEVTEGELAKFVRKVHGKPLPIVKWFVVIILFLFNYIRISVRIAFVFKMQ